jgi:hypothetical protein
LKQEFFAAIPTFMLILIHATTVCQDVTREVRYMLQTRESKMFEVKELRLKKIREMFKNTILN